MEEQKYILDGSKVLWHQERLKEWNYGNGSVVIVVFTVMEKCNVSISLIIWIKKLFLIFWMMRQK